MHSLECISHIEVGSNTRMRLRVRFESIRNNVPLEVSNDRRQPSSWTYQAVGRNGPAEANHGKPSR